MNKQQGEKRIDKEIFLLRNLPKEYKLGKKETQLGTLIDVSFCPKAHSLYAARNQ